MNSVCKIAGACKLRGTKEGLINSDTISGWEDDVAILKSAVF